MRGRGASRREWLLGTAAAVVGAATSPGVLRSDSRMPSGRLKQSVSRWPFANVPFDRFCQEAATMGIRAIDLLRPKDWERVRAHGLVCSMGEPTDRQDFIATGFNDRTHHPMLLAELEETIPLAARHNVPNVIAMFGNREGRRDGESIAACVEGLREIAPLATEHGVTVCVELLNSKVDHQDYQGDRTWFGIEVIDGVESPHVKLLYDIYHMQIMEGDVIRTIRDTIQHIAHFHTGGVPGRHELDESQELNYRAVATAIADQGFQGYLAHEFNPTGDPMAALRQAVETCDV